MFENVLGQQKIKNILTSQIKSGKIPHAYIFMGQNGVGKRFTAVEFVKILNCSLNDFSKTDAGACGKCLNCEKISRHSHPDLHFIDFAKQAEMLDEDLGKQKTLKIETIRYMQKEISIKAHEAKWKFFIVEPAEKMNAASANSLLKTLEEPPDNTIIILIARHKETIPQTIVSRSQTLFFQPLGQNEISSYLMLNHSLTSSKAQEIAALCEGSIENAEKLIEDSESEGLALWLKLKNEDLNISDILELSRSLARGEVIEYIDAMIAEAKKDFRLYPSSAIKTLEYLSNSRSLLLKNVNAQTVLDNLFFDLTELKKTSKMFIKI
ncbi:MAG: DNA polymerase III subunit delta' [Endomicrobia bacterium]|nr:DNA polymerase III subunit delta' [Endomicrobiia bacterium]MCL2799388.1 DNA polymerase III subunit delta' [Endomicrobiia bacterium]